MVDPAKKLVNGQLGDIDDVFLIHGYTQSLFAQAFATAFRARALGYK